jgi:hypothetical protein
VATHPSSASHAQALVVRVDGTVWHYNVYGATTDYVQVLGLNGLPLWASTGALSLTQSQSSWHIGCVASTQGTVWCFPAAGETLNDSTWLGAGLGSTDATSSVAQVVIAVGGAPLTGVTQISMSQLLQTPTTCAVANGNVWCWGNGSGGLLGRGSTGNSSFARQVKSDASTVFSDAVEVSVGTSAVCARKQDGSVWCWGTNGNGELGVPALTLGSSYYPVKVPFTGTTAQKTATKLNVGANATFCAVMQDTTVVCWGRNASGQAGEANFSASVTPTSVLASDGGSPLNGVIDLATQTTNASEQTCARNKALDVVCWGDGVSPFPFSYKDGTNTEVSGVNLALCGGASLGYIDKSGRPNMRGAVVSAPPCTL